ncbi:hypothetical protein BH11PSE1_BH11PSE1_24400 [soil metagenome]
MRKLLPATLALALIAAPAFAQDSATDASGASAATSQAVGLLASSGVKTAVGVSAVPASVVATGSVVAGSAVMASGAASVGVGGAVSEAATDSGRLVVDDKVVVSPDPAPAVPYNTPAPAKK